MKYLHKTLLFFTLGMSWLVTGAQTGKTGGANAANFAGSTPCDTYIKSMLKIPATSVCEFIKWEMTLANDGMDSGGVQLTVTYGESQPNTNGFKMGGNKILLNGKYVARDVNISGSKKKAYYLTGPGINSGLIIVRLDNNIFHFADSNGRYLLGNDGYSYVLNRIKN